MTRRVFAPRPVLSLDLATLPQAHWIKRLARAPRKYVLGASAMLLALVAAADWYTGRDLAVSTIYMIPIAIVAWSVGVRAGLVTAGTCLAGHIVADSTAAYPYSHRSLIWVNAMIDAAWFAFVAAAIAALRTSLKREETTSRTDALTGISNRRGFLDLLEREISRARRYRFPLTLAYVDCDNFKHVNDTWGHEAGDTVLRTVANALTDFLRGTDVAGRLGGDEFAVIFVATGADAAPTALAKLQERLRLAMERAQHPVTLSIGAVTFLSPPEKVAEVVSAADSLMYEVKKAEKNALRHLVAG